MSNHNTEIRLACKQFGVYLYSVAATLGVSEATLTRWLRYELPAEKKKQVMDAIEKVAAERK